MLRLAGAALLCALLASPSIAANNQFTSGGTTGSYGVRTGATNSTRGLTGQVNRPTTKNTSVMQPTYLGQLTPGGLPPTRLSSFVKDAGGSAELIYGDEGAWGIPPYMEFSEEHRIGSGINSNRLSTGHASTLPSAWGYAPGEQSYSGGYRQGSSPSFSVPSMPLTANFPTPANPYSMPAEPVYNVNVPNNVYGTSGF